MNKNIIIGILIVYLFFLSIYKEREMLGCKDNNPLDFLSGTPACDNSNNQHSRHIRHTKPKNVFDVYKRVVIWRRSFILSFLIVLIYHLIMDCTFEGIKMLTGIICGTFLIYFSFNFYQYHLDDYIEEEILNNYNITLK
jgi:hypothetical protein